MNLTHRSLGRLSRIVLPGMIAAAAATGTAAATPAPVTAPPSVQASAVQQEAKPTLHANRDTVKLWHTVVLTGRGHAGSAVEVQQRVGDGSWERFPATSVVRHDGGYQVRIQSGRLGRNGFRVIIHGATSPAVYVTVTR